MLHDASIGGLFIHDQGIVLECNQGLSEITGYTLDELIDMDALNTLVAPDWREQSGGTSILVLANPMKLKGSEKTK